MVDSSERRERKVRSRWLWGLLAGVALVAIAAVFWIDQTSVLPPVSRDTTPVAPAHSPTSAAQNTAPSAPSSPSPPAAQEAAAPPAPGPAPDAGQQATSSPAPTAPPPEKPAAPAIVAQEPSPPPSPAPPAETPLPPPAPGRETPPEAASEYAPKSLAQLVGTWAYSAADCERLFQQRAGRWAYREPVDKFAQAAIVESPKKILLPSAICRIESASVVKGTLKVSADCEDSISFTSRSVMIALRSPSELTYSASGDLVLATTLKKCMP